MYLSRYYVPLNYLCLVIFTCVQALAFSVATIVIQNSVFFEILIILAISSCFLANFSQITHKFQDESGTTRRNMYQEEELPIDIFSSVGGRGRGRERESVKEREREKTKERKRIEQGWSLKKIFAHSNPPHPRPSEPSSWVSLPTSSSR